MKKSSASSSKTSQGVQPKRFKKLPELVSLYLQPNQGLVTTLLYAVDREETAFTDEKDYSGNNEACMNTFATPFFSCRLSFLLIDGEDEKPPLPPRLASTSTPPASETPTDRYKVSVRNYFFSLFDKLKGLSTALYSNCQ